MNSDEIVKVLGDPQMVSGVLVAVCVAATIYTLATPFLSTDTLERRMKSVAVERERIRARERAAAKIIEQLDQETAAKLTERMILMKQVTE